MFMEAVKRSTGSVTRRRCREFYVAREAFFRSDFMVCESCFLRWNEKYNVGRYAVLVKDSEYVFIRQITRFMSLYKRRVWSVFGFLDKVDFQHHLVLEVNPHAFLRVANAYDFISKMWARLRANLFKKYGKFEFLRILEPHKSGFPHLHVLVFGIPFIDWNWLNQVWHEKYEGAGYVFRRDVGNSFNAVKYLLKYVNKMMATVGTEVQKSISRASTPFALDFSAILFASNKRLFSVSRGLLLMAGVRPVLKESKGYSYVGSVVSSLLDSFCVEHDLVVGQRFLRVVPTVSDLYENPLLFCIDGG